MGVMKKLFAGTDPQISDREREHAKLAREIAREGIVVLKNQGALPLPAQKIALFGSGARQTVKGGTGSGSVNERHSVSIEEGLEAAGFAITTKDWLDRYDKYYDDTCTAWKDAREAEIEGMTDIIEILSTVSQTEFLYPTGIPIEEQDIGMVDTDTALYVLARQAGEGADRTVKQGDFLLSPVEYENIKLLSRRFTKTIVVVNAGGQIDISELEQLPIQGLIYYGQAGQEGGHALADIISGKVSPSGKLTFSWVKSYEDIPFGRQYGAMGDPHQQDYLEDIYVGYRYYDTFGVEPAYPFGFGLSYTRFELADATVTWDGARFTVGGEVKNTGDCAGKEVVQVYVTVPFGEDGAEYQRLVGFFKTPLLGPDEACRYEIHFTPNDLTRYDAALAAFVLVDGDYIVRVGNSSRNTRPVCRVRLDRAAVLEQCTGVCPPKKELPLLQANTRAEEPLDGLAEIRVDADALSTICHSYGRPEVEIPAENRAILDAMPVEELAKLVIGGGVQGERIVEVFGASGSTTSELYEKYGIPNAITLDGPGGLNVANKFSVSSQWEILSLSVPPAYDFGIFGKHIRESIAKAEKDGVKHYQYATAWPCGNLLAQTWNTGLAEAMGSCVGVEMKELGGSVWLAPGLNIQKNPLCGRNFEYYSEDPVVSGKIAAAVTTGAQKHGIAVSVKHFCCNNVECERSTSSSNLSQRALREIYLKGFRIAVETAAPMTMMSSYNLVNGQYCCNSRDLLVKVLRNEWGFRGLVMTDWSACAEGKGDTVKAIAAENDLVMPGTPAEVQTICEAVEAGTLTREELYRCAARALALIRGTAAVEFKEE